MNNSFKNDILALEAFKFSISAFVKNIKFLLLSVVVSGLIFIGGIIASALVSLLFFIPFFMVLEKLKEMFIRITMINSFSAAMSGGVVDKAAQSWIVWQKFIVEVFHNFPYSIVFATFGGIVFITLFVTLLMMLGLGWVKITLDIADGRENKISNLFVSFSKIFRAFCVSSILLILMAIPFALTAFAFKFNVVLGGILIGVSMFITAYLVVKFAYNKLFLLDKDAGIIESMKLSCRLKGGAKNIVILLLLLIPVFIILDYFKNISGNISIESIKFVFLSLSVILQYVFTILTLIAMGKVYRILVVRSEQNR